MEPNLNKLKKATMPIKIRLFVATMLFLLASTVCAQDTPADSTLPRLLSPEALQAKQPESESNYSYGFSGIATFNSDQIDNGYGGGLSGMYHGFAPFVPTAGIDIVISSMDVEGLPDGDFIMIAPRIDMTVQGSLGRLQPFVGAGLSLYFNQLSFDEADEISLMGYDSTTRARTIDMGWGVAPNLKLGVLIPVAKKISLVFQGTFLWGSRTADIEYFDRVTREEWSGSVDYDMPSVWLSVGVIGGGRISTKDGR